MDEGEVLRVAVAVELERHLHDFFAAEFTAREIVEDHLAILLEEAFSFGNAFDVGVFELEPPVRLQLGQSYTDTLASHDSGRETHLHMV